MDICINENDVWIATTSGLSKYKNGNWTSFSIKDGLPSEKLSAVAVYNNNIFVGTNNGFCWIQ